MSEMSEQRTLYTRRRLLRFLERVWTRLEGFINRLAKSDERSRPFNPLYHLGPLAIFLLIVLTVTGIYLTVLYRPGTDRAYQSVLGISATWLGSLMRSVHRYAADGLIVVTLLHALKMFLSDRFWGSRWLAWVSGWMLVVLFGVIGIMGYWLVWDAPAQWLTEYLMGVLRGPFALSFLGADVAARTFSLFVIVLFLHVFVPLLLVIGIIIHVLRLTRARYWAPRWLMAIAVVALVIMSLARPAPLGAPANLEQLLGTVNLDWLYLGLLPLVSRFGGPAFWIVQLLLLGAVLSLPWLWRGQDEGPAFVLPQNCTGCAVCARECPFEAIEMVHRDDDSPYSSIAVVSPHLCTGCGICVGACPDKAIELDRLHSAVIRQDLQRNLAQAEAEGEPAVTVYACERHATLGTLPPLENARPLEASGVGGSIPILQAKLPPRVNVGTWPNSRGEPQPVITAVIPCMGMLHPNWAAESIEAGGAGVIVVGCPDGDCAQREGPHWIADRLKRRRTFRRGNTHFLEVAPGSRETVTSLWSKMIGDEEQAAQARQAPTAVGKASSSAPTPSPLARARNLFVGLALFLALLGLSHFLDRPTTKPHPDEALIRMAINHSGELMAGAEDLPPDLAEQLPENVDPAQVLGGERFPVRLRLAVDGQQVLEETYDPRGLRGEGSIYGLAQHWLSSGEHHLQMWLMDDGQEWQPVFDDTVQVTEGQALTLVYSEQQEAFIRPERDRASD